MIKKCFLPCIALNLSLLSCRSTSSTSTSLSVLPFFSFYTLLFMSLVIVVFRSFSQFGCNRWITGSSLWNFVISSLKTGLMLIRNVISVSTSLTQVLSWWPCMSFCWHWHPLAIPQAVMCWLLFLIFNSHSKAGIRESHQLWIWCTTISSSPRDSSISNRSCCQHEILLKM